MIIDVTRCSVALLSCEDLLQAFELVTGEESQKQFGYQICRADTNNGGVAP